MKKEEDLEVRQEQTTTIREESIKTEEVEINLLQENESTVLIGPINGWIEALEYDISGAVEMRMFLEEIQEKSIVYLVTAQGREYLLLRKTAQDGVGDQFNYSHEKIAISGRIGFTIKGSKGTRAKFRILYS